MKSTNKQCRATNDRRGAALVEFAIILPVFLSLMLGVLEIGKALEVSNLMSSAVREGGRLAAMEWEDFIASGTTPNQKVIGDIKNFLVASGVPAASITVTITSAEGSDA